MRDRAACHVILYAAGFKDHPVYEKDSLFQSALAETAMTAAGAYLVAALLLVLVGAPTSTASLGSFVAAVVTPSACRASSGQPREG